MEYFVWHLHLLLSILLVIGLVGASSYLGSAPNIKFACENTECSAGVAGAQHSSASFSMLSYLTYTPPHSPHQMHGSGVSH